MKQNLTHITTVLDSSSSMARIAKEMVQGLQDFVREQKAVPGEATFSLFRFSNTTTKLLDFVDLSMVELRNDILKPNGSTALYDCIGRAINSTGNHLAAMKESDRPAKVIMVIITDGEENCSTEFSQQQIKNMIELQEQTYNWQFVFLGANIDAVETGIALGISAQSCMTFDYSAKGTTEGLIAASVNLTNYRTGHTNQTSFVDPAKTNNVDSKDLADLLNDAFHQTQNSN